MRINNLKETFLTRADPRKIPRMLIHFVIHFVQVYNPKNNSWSDPLPPLSVISGPVRATLVVEDESIPPILTGR